MLRTRVGVAMRTQRVSHCILALSLTATACTSTPAPAREYAPPGYCGEPNASSDAGLVPASTGGPPPDVAGSVVLAFSRFYYGDTDRAGNASPCAWTKYGRNIDGKTTTKVSTDVCSLQPGAQYMAKTDGDDGIDNSFGLNLLPIILDLFGTEHANEALRSGDATTLVRLDRPVPLPTIRRCPGSSTTLFRPRARGGMEPTYATSTSRPWGTGGSIHRRSCSMAT